MTPKDGKLLKQLLEKYHVSSITDELGRVCTQNSERIAKEHPNWNPSIALMWRAHCTVLFLAGEAMKAQSALVNEQEQP